MTINTENDCVIAINTNNNSNQFDTPLYEIDDNSNDLNTTNKQHYYCMQFLTVLCQCVFWQGPWSLCCSALCLCGFPGLCGCDKNEDNVHCVFSNDHYINHAIDYYKYAKDHVEHKFFSVIILSLKYVLCGVLCCTQFCCAFLLGVIIGLLCYVFLPIIIIFLIVAAFILLIALIMYYTGKCVKIIYIGLTKGVDSFLHANLKQEPNYDAISQTTTEV